MFSLQPIRWHTIPVWPITGGDNWINVGSLCLASLLKRYFFISWIGVSISWEALWNNVINTSTVYSFIYYSVDKWISPTSFNGSSSVTNGWCSSFPRFSWQGERLFKLYSVSFWHGPLSFTWVNSYFLAQPDGPTHIVHSLQPRRSPLVKNPVFLSGEDCLPTRIRTQRLPLLAWWALSQSCWTDQGFMHVYIPVAFVLNFMFVFMYIFIHLYIILS